MWEATGGEGGIRTHGTREGTPHFECGTFDHSATSPAWLGHCRDNGDPNGSRSADADVVDLRERGPLAQAHCLAKGKPWA